ncbi:iron donor protein CyaY [Beggiatoa leptomitoformis]|uniref:Iron-sulfur cluster assembly protein CyaY n=1 Tax=Beggiatoa leptomitoformis TaxID=288004 RepID=A0A2N9YH03_9GAMM|nr:iron donor protein CyaY [Beggiatoa leptomitoformis]ALG68045.1 iron donor protein CyaY [Beggiatoa leptomitoformis]AUI69665.1 iron donor protein CyaY [Beggiatoa leptomitoformis]
MTSSAYEQLAEETLFAIEEAVESCGVEIDYENNGGILTLTFLNGSKIIINRQPPVQQLWVAAKAGGFHFNYSADAQHWITDDGQAQELFSFLSQLCSAQAGEPVTLVCE